MNRYEQTARAQGRHFWYQGFRGHLAGALDTVVAGGAARILECGCGTGAQMSVLGRYGRTFGFDVSPLALRLARSAGRPLACAEITRIPFRDATFDLVASFDVFQSLPDDAAALREMVRVLKPGGAVVVSMSALEVLRGDHAEAWQEIRRYRTSDVRRLAAHAGLDVVRVTYLFATLAPVLLALRRYQRWRRRRGAPRSEADMQMLPAPVNAGAAWVLRAEVAVARRWDLPFGSSLLLVARKPG